MTSGTTLFPGGVDNQTGADPFAFGYIPPLTHTALTQDVAVGDTTFHVVSTTGFETRGALAVGTSNGDTEHFTYTGLTATTFTGVTRAFGGTARVHVSGAMVAAIILPQTVNAHGAAIVALETRLRMLTSGPLANGSLVASVAALAWSGVYTSAERVLPVLLVMFALCPRVSRLRGLTFALMLMLYVPLAQVAEADITRPLLLLFWLPPLFTAWLYVRATTR